MSLPIHQAARFPMSGYGLMNNQEQLIAWLNDAYSMEISLSGKVAA